MQKGIKKKLNVGVSVTNAKYFFFSRNDITMKPIDGRIKQSTQKMNESKGDCLTSNAREKHSSLDSKSFVVGHSFIHHYDT